MTTVWICKTDDDGIEETTVHSTQEKAVEVAYAFVTHHWRDDPYGELPRDKIDAIEHFNDAGSTGAGRFAIVEWRTVDEKDAVKLHLGQE